MRSAFACWLALGLWAGAACFGADSRSGTAASKPAIPKPVPALPGKLPEAFGRPTPSSIADLKEIEQHVKTLTAKVSTAVLAVEVGDGTGSGIIISPDGLVLTAAHVCGSANRNARFVFPDGKTARGKTLGSDDEADIGLMRISGTGPWPYVPVGDMNSVQIGAWALAFGHPGGFDAKRSLVVRLGRIIRLSPTVLQTDCTISQGDSGGPLFDMHGRVIGIHNAISGAMVDNYHVPITQYLDAWDTLCGPVEVRATQPALAYAGVTIIGDTNGCRVTAVEKSGPASKAGLRVGDLMLKVEDREVKASASFERWLAESKPGDTLHLSIKRAERQLSLTVKLEPPPSQN